MRIYARGSEHYPMLFSKAVEGFILFAESGEYSPAYIPTLHGHLKYITKYFSDPELESITSDHWQQFWHHLHTEYKPKRFNGNTAPLQPASIDNYWKTIRSFYNWATKILSIQRTDLLLKRPKYESPQVQPFTKEEIVRMLESCYYTTVVKQSGKTYRIKRQNGDRDRALLMILLDTGMRLGELTRLKLGDINLENGEVYIRPWRSSRKSKGRTVFLGARTKQIIWKYIAKQQAKPSQSDPLITLTGASIRLQIHRIGKNAKVANAHPHKFRHTFAISYLRNGGDVFTLMRLLGHSTLDMVQRYVAIVKDDLANVHRVASPVDNWQL